MRGIDMKWDDEICSGDCDYCRFKRTVPGTDERFDREPQYYCAMAAEWDEEYRKIMGLEG